MVEETLINEMRSAIAFATAGMSFSLCPSWFRFSHPALQPLLDRVRHQPLDISTQPEHFLDEPGTDK
jgi:hypothetical protein